jgi:hypothetical protein
MIIKGKIIDIVEREKVTNIIIMNKIGDTNKYAPICFTGFSEAQRIIAILKIEKGDTIKIKYHIFSKKYNKTDTYYTTLFIEDIKILQKNTNQLSVDLDGNYN